MAAVRAALLAPLLALCRAGPGPAPAARVEVAVTGPGPGQGPGDGGGSAAAGPGGSYTLRGAVLGAGGPRDEEEQEEIRGRLLLVGDAEPELGTDGSWIGVVPVGEEPAELPRGAREESFTTAVVSKMKRALVLGASALLILALNQNAIRELDVSQLLAKPVIVIQSSDNVTRLLGALLRYGWGCGAVPCSLPGQAARRSSCTVHGLGASWSSAEPTWQVTSSPGAVSARPHHCSDGTPRSFLHVVSGDRCCGVMGGN
ncbi:RING finger protein 215 [Pezoporus occidentalis]|uniref:RING finger protein 215 n=1 Tax=Pezoporus occidentalis TaxID=407982 RepID=UPI002F91A6C2